MLNLKGTYEGRLLGMDFVRVFALLGVVLYHCAAAYSTNTPYWNVHDGSSVIATGIREFVDVFIMPAFFFLAGYFTLSSLRKRGYWSFFKAKFWELGYIWLWIVLLILPMLWYFIDSRDSGTSSGFLHSWIAWIQGAGQTTLGVATSTGQMVHMHFWFVSLLFYFFLVFMLVHFLLRKWTRRRAATPTAPLPANTNVWRALAIFAVATTLGYYVSLLVFPDTSWLDTKLFLQLQPSKLLLFAAYFGFGIYLGSKNWFAQGKTLGPLRLWAPAAVLAGAGFLVLGQKVFSDPAGTTTLSPAYLLLFAVVRSVLLLSVLATITTFAMRYANRPSRLIHSLADNSYYIYLIHAIVVSFLQDILMVWPDGPVLVKLPAVFLLGTAMSYALSRWVFRKLTIRDWVSRGVFRLKVRPVGNVAG